MRKGSRAVRFRAESDAVENCREIKRLQEDVIVATRNVKQLKEQVSQLERQIKTMLLDSNKKHETLLGRFDSLSAQMHHTMAISDQQQPQQQQQQEEIRTKTKMQILFVNTKGETRSLVVKSIDTIDKVKLEIAEMEGIPAEDQRLIFQGWELENGKTLADYHVTDNASIHLVARFRGRYL